VFYRVPPDQEPELVGDANIVIDEVLRAVSDYLRKINFTQFDIPDQDSDFEFVRGELC